MEIKRCKNGHFYDAEANSTCPQCAAESEIAGGGVSVAPVEYGKTVPMDPPAYDMGGYAMNNGVMDETMPLEGGSGFTRGFFDDTPQVTDYEEVTGPVNVNGVPGFAPVVGWLVCIEGPARGTDYRIRAGYNYIGRGDHMDICIKGDEKISRDKQALIAYDQEERLFFFGHVSGKFIDRLNGKTVMNPQELQSHDILTIGSTKLMFVPLCGERFDWNE